MIATLVEDRQAGVGPLRPTDLPPSPPSVSRPGSPAWRRRTKRAVDVVGAAVGLVVLLPLLLLVAVAIMVASGQPVLFRQERVGRHGRGFTCLKFRTMVPDAEARLAEVGASNVREGPLFKADHDPRVTPVGRLLRATSLDELPQLLNVLAGSMSLVGPRPSLPAEHEQFDEELRQRVLVRPGMTGLWQVRPAGDNSFESYRLRDLEYVRSWSLRMDLAILVRTAAVVARGVTGLFGAGRGRGRAGVLATGADMR